MSIDNSFVPLKTVKEALASGQRFGFIGRFSNNMLDNDYPREVLTSKAQKDFAMRCATGQAELPFLCLMHNENTKFGETVAVTYNGTDKIGFAVGFGIVDEGKEFLVESLIESGVTYAMSHGYGRHPVERDKSNRTHVTKFTSHELTVATKEVAANKLTVIKFFPIGRTGKTAMNETQMLEQATQIASMLQIDVDAVATVLKSNVNAAEAIGNLVFAKTKTEEIEEVEAVEETQVTEVAAEEAQPEKTETVLEATTDESSLKSAQILVDVADKLASLDKTIAALAERIDQVETREKTAMTVAQRVAEVASVESLLDLAAQKISVVGKPAAVVADQKAAGEKAITASEQPNPYGQHAAKIGVGA